MQNEEIMPYIAERLKLLRGLRKLSLEKIANQMGLSRKQIQNYENCNCAIPVVRLWQLANIMKVNMDFFWEGLNGNNANSNDDLQLIKMFHKIKDKDVKKNIVRIIETLAEN
ncbi:MAG: helix-turn-helix transcriptional regulator [Alphaproteobacteria bacterium]|nr:helix-turn-helix transcriptional regulator [Alphaproteobacteria bacterium]